MSIQKKFSDTKEIRNIQVGKLEIRTLDGTDRKIIEGYVNKFNQQSSVMRDYWGDEFVEVISDSAFNRTLETKSQKALWNHNVDLTYKA